MSEPICLDYFCHELAICLSPMPAQRELPHLAESFPNIVRGQPEIRVSCYVGISFRALKAAVCSLGQGLRSGREDVQPTVLHRQRVLLVRRLYLSYELDVFFVLLARGQQYISLGL